MIDRNSISKTGQSNLQPDNRVIRQSGVELLRLIAMIMICIAHCTQTMERFVDFQTPTTDWHFLLLRLMRFGGTIGNILFVVCSSYFLVGKRSIKVTKIVNLLIDSQIISIGIFVCFCLFAKIKGSQMQISFGIALNHIFPDLFEAVWFVPCYAVFYLLHPALNLCMDNLSHKQHLAFCIGIFFVYGLCGLIRVRPVFSAIVGFICIFVIVAYVKKYHSAFIQNSRSNLRGFIICLIVFIGIILLKNYSAFYSDYFLIYPDIDGLTSIVFLPMLICLFHLFVNMKFSSRFINYLASCSLFFYCIHENKIIREEIRPQFYSFLIDRFGESHLLLYVFILILLLLIGGFISAVVYKETIHRISATLSKKIVEKTGNAYDRFFEKTKL